MIKDVYQDQLKGLLLHCEQHGKTEQDEQEIKYLKDMIRKIRDEKELSK